MQCAEENLPLLHSPTTSMSSSDEEGSEEEEEEEDELDEAVSVRAQLITKTAHTPNGQCVTDRTTAWRMMERRRRERRRRERRRHE